MRFKRIQTALADGRLDEAFDLLRDPDLRAHRTGQKLLTQLSEACLARGREHLEAQRLSAALEDCNRAEKLAGNTAEVQDLRRRICLTIEDARVQSRRRAEQLARAKAQLENGMLSAGREMLDGCEDGQALLLLKNAELDRTAADSAVKRVRAALDGSDVKQAIALYRQGRLDTSSHDQAAAVLKDIAAAAAGQVRRFMQAGQLAAAVSLLESFNGQARQFDELQSLRQAVGYCLSGARAAGAGRFAQAAVDLQKALLLNPEAGWIKEAVKEARLGAQAYETLQTGPLGLVETASLAGPDTGKKMDEPDKLWKQTPLPQPLYKESCPSESQMKKYLLQIDGIGSFVVLPGRCVTVGPISSSMAADVGLVTSPEAQVKQIRRSEGDYFMSDKGSEDEHLLSDGDRIEITPRCRLQFTLPHPASGTAVLKLGGARLPRSDVQSILLMDREILIGPARNCHVQSGQVTSIVTLFGRDERFYAKSEGGEQEAIETGQTVRIGSLRFVLVPYTG